MKNIYFKKSLKLIFLFFIVIVVSRWIMYTIIDKNEISLMFLYQGLIKLILLIIAVYLIKKETFFDLKYLSRNKIFSLLISIILIGFSLYNSLNKIENLNIQVTFFDHASYFFQCLCTGFFEEFFFRCLVFGYICYGFRVNSVGEPKNNYKQVMITSFLFAIVHSSNFFNREYNGLSVLNQIMFAFVIGILLQSLFYKSNNIYLNAIVHAMINYNGMITQKLYKIENVTIENSEFNDFIQTLFTFIILLIIVVLPFSYFSLRNKKNLLIQQVN